jgi:hypothetical protein
LKTVTELDSLLRQRTWDKDVVLWVGPENVLVEALGHVKHIVLDLLDLFDENKLPIDDEETRDQMVNALREKLRGIPTGPGSRTVMVVKSVGLLARYNIGTREFYDWFCGDFSMVVLVIEEVVRDISWPDEVICDGDRLLDYFEPPNVVNGIFGTRG